jgi:lipoprotein NlpD
MSKSHFDKAASGLASLSLVIALAGCVNVGQPGQQADSAASRVPAAAPATSPADVVAQPAAPAAVAPAVYKVRRGDTLSGVAHRHGCTVKQLLAWNKLKSSARLKRGQVLVVSAPNDVRATTGVAAEPAAAAASLPNPVGAASSAAPSPDVAREVTAEVARHAGGVALAWPAQGKVVEAFQPGETRGIEIGGKPGDPVRAAADGKVMYAGTGLNEYGSLIIVQHNKDFLTAYSHNRKLLVKSGDIVRQGQQIAEMGNENNSRVSVLFELRRDGKPVDPMPYLPQGHG